MLLDTEWLPDFLQPAKKETDAQFKETTSKPTDIIKQLERDTVKVQTKKSEVIAVKQVLPQTATLFTKSSPVDILENSISPPNLITDNLKINIKNVKFAVDLI